ncbi:MAG: hypothetical protein LH470_12085 [Lysobacter sp.]|nr:hypothetical protein [Lysobacter sp.]
MATAKAGKSKVAKTTKTAAKKSAAKRPAAAKKAAPPKGAARKVVAKKPVAKQAVAKKAVKKVDKKAASKTVTRTPVARQGAVSKIVKKTAKKTAKQSASAVETRKAIPAHSPATKNAPPNKASPRQPAVAERVAAVPMKPSPSGSTTGKAGRKPRKITPEQALANTRALLEAKKEHDRQPQRWQLLDQQAGPVDHAAGYQSPEAADKADQLHEGESRMQAIQGSISSSDRKNQGKRDSR